QGYTVPCFYFFFYCYAHHLHLHSFPTRRSSDLRPHHRAARRDEAGGEERRGKAQRRLPRRRRRRSPPLPRASRQPRRHAAEGVRSEEHTSELQSRRDLVCRLLLEKKKHKT